MYQQPQLTPSSSMPPRQQQSKAVGTTSRSTGGGAASSTAQQNNYNPYGTLFTGVGQSQSLAYPTAAPLMQPYYAAQQSPFTTALPVPPMMMMMQQQQQQQQASQSPQPQMFFQQQHQPQYHASGNHLAHDERQQQAATYPHSTRITRYTDTLTRSTGKKATGSGNKANAQQQQQTSSFPQGGYMGGMGGYYGANGGFMLPAAMSPGGYVNLPPVNNAGTVMTPMSPIMSPAAAFTPYGTILSDGWQSPMTMMMMMPSPQSQQTEMEGGGDDGPESIASGYRRERRNSATQTKLDPAASRHEGRGTQERYYNDETQSGPDRNYRPYTIREFRELKRKDNQVRLGRLGPDPTSQSWRQAVSYIMLYLHRVCCIYYSLGNNFTFFF